MKWRETLQGYTLFYRRRILVLIVLILTAQLWDEVNVPWLGPVEVRAQTGTTYYVSLSGGQDSNDGLSPGKAWQTIGKVNRTNFKTASGTDFVNTAGQDYHLTVGASLIDSGVSISAVTVDRDGVARPQDSGYDVGTLLMNLCLL